MPNFKLCKLLGKDHSGHGCTTCARKLKDENTCGNEGPKNCFINLDIGPCYYKPNKKNGIYKKCEEIIPHLFDGNDHSCDDCIYIKRKTYQMPCKKCSGKYGFAMNKNCYFYPIEKDNIVFHEESTWNICQAENHYIHRCINCIHFVNNDCPEAGKGCTYGGSCLYEEKEKVECLIKKEQEFKPCTLPDHNTHTCGTCIHRIANTGIICSKAGNECTIQGPCLYEEDKIINPDKTAFHFPIKTIPNEDAVKFWEETYPDGAKISDIQNELIDFARLCMGLPKLYCHITNGLLSKPNTDIDQIIRIADHCQRKDWDEYLEEELEPYKVEIEQLEALRDEDQEKIVELKENIENLEYWNNAYKEQIQKLKEKARIKETNEEIEILEKALELAILAVPGHTKSVIPWIAFYRFEAEKLLQKQNEQLKSQDK